MAAAVAKPRYAPSDPSLPKPWKGLIDGKTGFLYFWNTETNVTQYERPASRQPSPPPARLSPSPQRFMQQPQPQARQGPGLMNSSFLSKVGQEPTDVQSHGQVMPVSKEIGEAYRRQHEITVMGGDVPYPFTTFGSTGFPSEILREMRYLLQGGANVVHCTASGSLLGRLACG